MVLLRILVARREPNDVAIVIPVTLREEVATIDRDCTLDTVLTVMEYLRSSRDVVLVHAEQIGLGVQIETRNARPVSVRRMVVLAEHNAR